MMIVKFSLEFKHFTRGLSRTVGVRKRHRGNLKCLDIAKETAS